MRSTDLLSGVVKAAECSVFRNSPNSESKSVVQSLHEEMSDSSALARAAAYFPPRSLGSDDGLHTLLAVWYSRSLQELEEEPLTGLAAGNVYRLLYLPTFAPAEVVHLACTGDRIRLLKKFSKGMSGFDPCVLRRAAERTLWRGEARSFRRRLHEADYWMIPSYDDEHHGPDGCRCLLESVSRGAYRVVDRWCPEEPALVNLITFLLSLPPRDGLSRFVPAAIYRRLLQL